MPKTYLENTVIPGQVRIKPTEELGPLRELYQMARDGKLDVVTSRESWREQERAQDPVDCIALEQGRNEVLVVEDDHRVLGFDHSQDHLGGFVANPIVTDIGVGA